MIVVLYLKDTEKWKQFTTSQTICPTTGGLCCISKILKNESNSQRDAGMDLTVTVVLYLKDTEKWKQFTTRVRCTKKQIELCCISKILKNESNSQHHLENQINFCCCVVSQRYWKMKAIHN